MSLEESISDWVDRIAKRIPGFSGYYKKEERRENDQKLREKIASKLGDVQDIINEKGRRITKSGDISPLDRIGQLSKRLEKLKDSVRYADYGYSGFFDQKEVSESTLRSVYRFDLKLLDWIENFISSVDTDTALDDISNNIENGFELLDKRLQIIEGD
ncbi:hypothetical protein KAW18_00865 [candidate division WOR-3 bacterium]|nr:hypothetical protein [candidate division WOR-3 bacterium]MCK4525891.1 hypothetical protein [candidate division WOR-3 bacterium]